MGAKFGKECIELRGEVSQILSGISDGRLLQAYYLGSSNGKICLGQKCICMNINIRCISVISDV